MDTSEFGPIRYHPGTMVIITSPKTVEYNCFAWAVGEKDRWWSPVPGYYWPDSVPRSFTLGSFEQLYQLHGYLACFGMELELGFEKIAIYADSSGEVTHAARQLSNGAWTSKLGKSHDVQHSLPDLEGTKYGRVRLIMKRKVAVTNAQ